jgi:hypothetical protein
VYFLDPAVTVESFVNNFTSNRDENSRYPAIIEDSWQAPLVFQGGQPNESWFIDVGRYTVLGDWRVFSSKGNDVICTIGFFPRGENPSRLLPPPVMALANKLDEVLGADGEYAGTLQSVARVRGHSWDVLANAALRPWALTDSDGFNPRSEVDAGLKGWAEVNNSRRRLLGEIVKAYPLAERSLAEYYVNTYGLSSQDAREVAAWTIDLIYRSFFVFHRDLNYYYDVYQAKENPWPTDHRFYGQTAR